MRQTRFFYLHGFASGPSSKKARFFRQRLAESGIGLEIPDLAQGDFEHLTMSGQLKVIEAMAGSAPAVLIGSSMGGYLAALYAASHPSVQRLLLLAPAFDLAARWPAVVGNQQASDWKSSRVMSLYHHGDACDRRLSYAIVEDGAQYEAYPDFTQPALIFHGRRDTTVPPEYSERFAREHRNVKLMLLDSDHELIDVLPAMWDESAQFLTEGR